MNLLVQHLYYKEISMEKEVWEEDEYLGWRISATGIIIHPMIYFGHHLTEIALLIWCLTSEMNGQELEEE